MSCPPVAIRGQKSPAGLISLRKCTGNLSIILSLNHPLLSRWLLASWCHFFPRLSCGVGNTRFSSRARLQTPWDTWGLLSWVCCLLSCNAFIVVLIHDSWVSSRKLFLLFSCVIAFMVIIHWKSQRSLVPDMGNYYCCRIIFFVTGAGVHCFLNPWWGWYLPQMLLYFR